MEAHVEKRLKDCEKKIKEVLEKYKCAFKVTVLEDFGTGQRVPSIHIIPKPEEPKQ